MMFQPLAKEPSMKALGRASVSRNSILCGSSTTISPTVVKSDERGRSVGRDFSPEQGGAGRGAGRRPCGAEKGTTAQGVGSVFGDGLVTHEAPPLGLARASMHGCAKDTRPPVEKQGATRVRLREARDWRGTVAVL